MTDSPEKPRKKPPINKYGHAGKIGALSRKYVEVAVTTLATVMSSRAAPDAARVDAAIAILRSARGKL